MSDLFINIDIEKWYKQVGDNLINMYDYDPHVGQLF